MRKSIFDIVTENTNIASDVKRILSMAQNEKILCVNGYTYYKLFDFIDTYCFKYWLHRNHCIDVDDYLKTIKFSQIKSDAASNPQSLLTLIELIYNFWQLADNELSDDEKDYRLQWCGNFYHLRRVMDDILNSYNHKAYTNNDFDCILVIEDKEEITAVAEILPHDLSFDVIKYNHRSLQGEVELKKSILISLGAELEPKRKELESLNKKLSEDIFFMLNNINIRHNNRSKKDMAKYKEYVAKMKKSQLEKWYDELYQMMLLSFLLLDNTKRTEKVKELKTKVIGGQANG